MGAALACNAVPASSAPARATVRSERPSREEIVAHLRDAAEKMRNKSHQLCGRFQMVAPDSVVTTNPASAVPHAIIVDGNTESISTREFKLVRRIYELFERDTMYSVINGIATTIEHPSPSGGTGDADSAADSTQRLIAAALEKPPDDGPDTDRMTLAVCMRTLGALEVLLRDLRERIIDEDEAAIRQYEVVEGLVFRCVPGDVVVLLEDAHAELARRCEVLATLERANGPHYMAALERACTASTVAAQQRTMS